MADGIKGLVGRKMSKNVDFLGTKVEISKLSVTQVTEIQEAAKSNNGENGLDLIRMVIRMSVTGGTELTDEEMSNFPMDELSKLSGEIMKFSGIGENVGK